MLKRILFVCLIFVSGCESSGPEFIGGGDTQSFQGVLQAEDTSNRHSFVLTNEGTVRLELTQLFATDSETDQAIETPSIVISIGRLSELSECQITFSKVLVEGDSFSVRLDNTAYCLQVFRSSTMPVTSVVVYDLALLPSFS